MDELFEKHHGAEMSTEDVLEGQHVLMVLAHCDDELICGWPILQNPAIRKSLLIVSTDLYNEQRQWCQHRKYVTQDLCQQLKIDVSFLDFGSDFHTLNHRVGELVAVEEAILKQIDRVACDYLFTHNPYGEYGHLDHIFISNLLLRTTRQPILITDMGMKSDWSERPPASEKYKSLYFRSCVGRFSLDNEFYRRVFRFYETRGVWTWGASPVQECGLYVIS